MGTLASEIFFIHRGVAAPHPHVMSSAPWPVDTQAKVEPACSAGLMTLLLEHVEDSDPVAFGVLTQAYGAARIARLRQQEPDAWFDLAVFEELDEALIGSLTLVAYMAAWSLVGRRVAEQCVPPERRADRDAAFSMLGSALSTVVRDFGPVETESTRAFGRVEFGAIPGEEASGWRAHPMAAQGFLAGYLDGCGLSGAVRLDGLDKRELTLSVAWQPRRRHHGRLVQIDRYDLPRCTNSRDGITLDFTARRLKS